MKLTKEQLLANFGGKRGKRGPKKFPYTYEDIAEAAGTSVAYVKACSTNRYDINEYGEEELVKPAELDPSDLRSVAQFVIKERIARGLPVPTNKHAE